MDRIKNRRLKLLILLSLIGVCVLSFLLLKLIKSETLNAQSDDSTLASERFCDDYIRFLDVGQGDCALLSSNGRNVLIDTGTPQGADELCAKLRKYGVKTEINAALLSHFHDDHSGGLEAIVSRFTVNNLILPSMQNSDSVLKETQAAKRAILAEDGELYVAKQGTYLIIGDIELTVLAYYGTEEDENDRSVFYMAEIHGKKFLFAGDAGKSAEGLILKEGLDLKCDVLKLGHHGSNTSSCENFLDAIAPDYAVISCGIANQYSHPGAYTLGRLEERNIKTLRTDINGDITFEIFENGSINTVLEK